MIFIFGHSGFIGQHLTKFFDKNKIDYTRVNRDNLYNFNLEVSSKDIFINLIGHSHSKINNKKTYFKFINANIEVVDQIIFLAKKFNINKLIHISSLRVYVNSYLDEIKVEKNSLALPDTISTGSGTYTATCGDGPDGDRICVLENNGTDVWLYKGSLGASKMKF